MIEIITIERQVNRWIVVPHRSTNSRLWFYAPGIEVYVRGENAAKEFDTLANIAMNEALSRHIPAISLKTCYPQYKKKSAPESADDKPRQKILFPPDDTTKGDDDATNS